MSRNWNIHSDQRYITVGGCSHAHSVHPFMPDMSWLGDPPTPEESRRYERLRLSKYDEKQKTAETRFVCVFRGGGT